MAKIYVVTEGSYSDYRICAVTVDKDAAERAAKLCDGEIEEYDDFAEIESVLNNGFSFYTVFINEAGETLSISKRDFPEDVSTTGIELATKTRILYFHGLRTYRVFCYARDEAHAEKIAYDAIAQYKAEQEGIC